MKPSERGGGSSLAAADTKLLGAELLLGALALIPALIFCQPRWPVLLIAAIFGACLIFRRRFLGRQVLGPLDELARRLDARLRREDRAEQGQLPAELMAVDRHCAELFAGILAQEQQVADAHGRAEEGQMQAAIKAGVMRELVSGDSFTEQVRRAFQRLALAVPSGHEERFALFVPHPDLGLVAVCAPEQLDPDDAAALREAAHSCLDLHRTLSGSRWEAFPIHIANGELIGVLCHGAGLGRELLRDIIEMVSLALLAEQRRQELETACRAAEEATRLKAAFLANMSHEIRTPMNAILGHAQLLERSQSLPPDLQSSVSSISRAGEWLLHLINDILDLSKIQASKLQLELAAVNPASLARDAAVLFKPRAAAQKLSLELELPPSSPPLLCDPRRISQVLANLLSNAVKFTEEGGIKLRLSSKLDAAGLVAVRIEVEDSGVGIAEAEKASLFTKFEQGSAGRSRGGTGLGLAISREIARMHMGDLSYEPAPGRGSRFIFEFRGKPAPPPSATPERRRRRAMPGSGFRIIAIDDNSANLELLQAICRQEGILLRSFDSARPALEAIIADPPQLIVTDIVMPDLDGFSFLQLLRERLPEHPPVIAASASVDADAIARIRQGPFAGFLNKPLDINLFLQACAEHGLPLADADEETANTGSLQEEIDSLGPDERRQLAAELARGDLRAMRRLCCDGRLPILLRTIDDCELNLISSCLESPPG
ncbi:MAG: hypothetical protein RL095_815 [Verrucomicrobiota bacterium]|jgi:signal transduction histidine kinase/FixJ family two-component response regulator